MGLRNKSVVFFNLTGLLLFTGCAEKEDLGSADESKRPVKLIEISSGATSSTTRYPAVIDAGVTVELSFAVGGVIQELPVTDSQEVQAGSLIAKLDPRDFQSSVASARASYVNAEEEYQRAVRLADQDAIATNVLNQRKSQRDVAKAQLDGAEKALAD